MKVITEIITSVLIIISRKDEAGMNMLKPILGHLKAVKMEFLVQNTFPEGLYEYWATDSCSVLIIPEHQIYCDYLIPYVKAKLIIFASKHFSSAGQKALLVHTTGLWDESTNHGGKDRELSIAPAYALYYGYHKIKSLQSKYQLDHYWVGIEVTHHGPTSFDIPTIFIETGGTIEEWSDQNACDLIAQVVVEVANIYSVKNIHEIEEKITMIGIGGGHYAPAFIRRMDEERYYLGHIMPKFVLGGIDKVMVQQAWDRTQALDKIFLIDKKGTKSEDRHRILGYIEELGYKWEYSKS